MIIRTPRTLVTPLLLSLLVVTIAALLWRSASAQAAGTHDLGAGCVVLDKQPDAGLAAIRRTETMLALHRGW